MTVPWRRFASPPLQASALMNQLRRIPPSYTMLLLFWGSGVRLARLMTLCPWWHHDPHGHSRLPSWCDDATKIVITFLAMLRTTPTHRADRCVGWCSVGTMFQPPSPEIPASNPSNHAAFRPLQSIMVHCNMPSSLVHRAERDFENNTTIPIWMGSGLTNV